MQEDNQLTFSNILDLLFTSESVPIQHLYRLSDMGTQETDEFQQYWADAEDDRRIAIAQHLADLSEDNFVVDFAPVFAYLLGDNQAFVRLAALDGLWDCEDENLVDPIINLLVNDPLVEVRAAAARSLAHFLLMAEWGQIRGRKKHVIFDALRQIYNDRESDLLIRGAALEAMGSFSHPEVSEYISESYEGSFPELQRSALFAMGSSADPRWLPLLRDEMESPYPDFRAEAARAAGVIGASESVAPLAELIYDEDEDVARAAILALGQIGGERATRILENLIADIELAHLHEAAHEGLDESLWADSDLQLFSWSESELEDGADFGDEFDEI